MTSYLAEGAEQYLNEGVSVHLIGWGIHYLLGHTYPCSTQSSSPLSSDNYSI